MRRLTVDQLYSITQKMRNNTGNTTLREEIAGLSQGNPVNFITFMDMTRYDMWVVALGAK
jgi:hypothetical protein